MTSTPVLKPHIDPDADGTFDSHYYPHATVDNALALKADQTALDTANAILASKANQGDLDTTNADVAANTAAVAANTAAVARVDPGTLPTASQSLRGTPTSRYWAPSSFVAPEDHGGRADSVFDNVTAFADAVAEAKVSGTGAMPGVPLYLPGKYYKTSGPLVLPRSGLTPINVVPLRGNADRGTRLIGIAPFTLGGDGRAGLVEWEGVAKQIWHNEIRDLNFLLPNTTGVYAILHRKIGTGTTSADYVAEWIECDLINVLFEGSNDYATAMVHSDVGWRASRISNVDSDPSRGSGTYDTAIFEVPSQAGGVDPSIGADTIGIASCVFTDMWAGKRQGGYQRYVTGRVTSSIFDAGFCDGGTTGPGIDLINSHQSTFRNIRTEGKGEKPKWKLAKCAYLAFENCGVGGQNPTDARWQANHAYAVGAVVVTSGFSGSGIIGSKKRWTCTVAGTSGATDPFTNDTSPKTDGTVTWTAGADAVGNGIELVGSSHIRWRTRPVTPGNVPYSNRLSYVLSIDATSVDNVFADFDVVEWTQGSAANEIQLLATPDKHNLIFGYGVYGATPTLTRYVVGWHPEFPHIVRKPVTVTASRTLDIAEQTILVNATAGAVTLTPPSAAGIATKRYIVKKTDASANGWTFVGTVDGGTNLTNSTQNQAVTIESDGTNWQVVGRS